LMVDGRRGIGNGRTIPAGPLRAPLETQVAHAQAVVFVGQPVGLKSLEERARHYGAAIFHGRLEPDRQILAALSGRKVLAFAGIGDPEKFFATLTDAGIEVAARASFPDHHRYTAHEAQSLLAQADAANLMLLTTEKDLARLGDDPNLSSLAARAGALPVRLVIEQADAFRALVLNAGRRRLGTAADLKSPSA
jgi:tetraacyldisaccharide 4'-kinase